MSGNTQLQDIVIHEFLDLFFGVGAVRKVSLCVDIDERGGSRIIYIFAVSVYGM